MSFGFDPLVGTVLHPGNPENGVRHAIGNMLTSTIMAMITDLEDPRATHSLNGREVKDRIVWLNEELTKRSEEARAQEAHRVRAEEANLYAELGDLADEGAALREGKVDDI